MERLISFHPYWLDLSLGLGVSLSNDKFAFRVFFSAVQSPTPLAGEMAH